MYSIVRNKMTDGCIMFTFCAKLFVSHMAINIHYWIFQNACLTHSIE